MEAYIFSSGGLWFWRHHGTFMADHRLPTAMRMIRRRNWRVCLRTSVINLVNLWIQLRQPTFIIRQGNRLRPLILHYLSHKVNNFLIFYFSRILKRSNVPNEQNGVAKRRNRRKKVVMLDLSSMSLLLRPKAQKPKAKSRNPEVVECENQSLKLENVVLVDL